jgi:hypothetical protein
MSALSSVTEISAGKLDRALFVVVSISSPGIERCINAAPSHSIHMFGIQAGNLCKLSTRRI